MEILELSLARISDINKANELFESIGRIKPAFADNKWEYMEELYAASYIKTYPNGDCDYSD